MKTECNRIPMNRYQGEFLLRKLIGILLLLIPTLTTAQMMWDDADAIQQLLIDATQAVQDDRLDVLELSQIVQDDRLDALDSLEAVQDNRLTTLEASVGGLTVIDSLSVIVGEVFQADIGGQAMLMQIATPDNLFVYLNVAENFFRFNRRLHFQSTDCTGQSYIVESTNAPGIFKIKHEFTALSDNSVIIGIGVATVISTFSTFNGVSCNIINNNQPKKITIELIAPFTFTPPFSVI